MSRRLSAKYFALRVKEAQGNQSERCVIRGGFNLGNVRLPRGRLKQPREYPVPHFYKSSAGLCVWSRSRLCLVDMSLPFAECFVSKGCGCPHTLARFPKKNIRRKVQLLFNILLRLAGVCISSCPAHPTINMNSVILSSPRDGCVFPFLTMI